ncbi:MAG TPA: hypothetical protein VFQ61_04115 [Polyangiaceae bacterium]|nr:hypothetical protein [Polyangiaceae bacterium]
MPQNSPRSVHGCLGENANPRPVYPIAPRRTTIGRSPARLDRPRSSRPIVARGALWLGTLASLLLVACSASTQKPALDTALDNPQLRHESLEATLRVTDEHPEYVDELFALTLKHPKTLDRFLQNTAAGLEQDELSRQTARRLVERPAGLKQVLIATLDAASDKPASLGAAAEAMQERPQLAAMVVTQREETLRAVMRELMKEVSKNRRARLAFLASVQENSAAMAAILAPNPEVLASLLKAFGKLGLSHGKEELEALIKAVQPQE